MRQPGPVNIFQFTGTTEYLMLNILGKFFSRRQVEIFFIFSQEKGFDISCKLSPMNFVCVEVLRPSQPNGVMSSAVSLPNHMFTGQA